MLTASVGALCLDLPSQQQIWQPYDFSFLKHPARPTPTTHPLHPDNPSCHCWAMTKTGQTQTNSHRYLAASLSNVIPLSKFLPIPPLSKAGLYCLGIPMVINLGAQLNPRSGSRGLATRQPEPGHVKVKVRLNASLCLYREEGE